MQARERASRITGSTVSSEREVPGLETAETVCRLIFAKRAGSRGREKNLAKETMETESPSTGSLSWESKEKRAAGIRPPQLPEGEPA
jgi:hypothetical protein